MQKMMTNEKNQLEEIQYANLHYIHWRAVMLMTTDSLCSLRISLGQMESDVQVN